MKKASSILIAIIIALIIILVLIPWGTGYFFKQNYLRIIDNFNQRNETRINVVDYTRGWFKSHVVLKIIPNSASPAEKDISNLIPKMNDLTTITINQTISHGPFVYDRIKKRLTIAFASIKSIIHLPSQIESMLYGQSKPEGIGTIYSVVDYRNHWNQLIQVLPVSLKPQSIVSRVDWGGINGSTNFHVTSDVIDRIKTDLVFGALTISTDKKTAGPFQFDFTMQPISETSDSTLHSIGLWYGDVNLNLPSLSVNYLGKLLFSIDGFAFKGNSKITSNSLYSLENHVSIKKISAPDYVIPSLTSLSSVFSLNDINATQLLQLINVAKQENKNTNVQELEKQYTELLLRLITLSSHANLDFSTNTTLGMATIKGEASWPTNVALPKTFDDFNNNVNAKIDIRIAMPLADEILNQTIKKIAQRESATMLTEEKSNTSNPKTEEDQQKETFQKVVAKHIHDGTLPLTTAIQILSLYDKHLSPTEFADSLKKYIIMPETQNDLITLYTQLQAQQSQSANKPHNPAEMQQAISSSMKSQFDELVKQGYIIKDKNDYVISITYANGVMKINGKELPQELMTPSLPTQAPAATTPSTPSQPETVKPLQTVPTQPSTTPSIPQQQAPTQPSVTPSTPLQPATPKPAATQPVNI